MGRAGGGVGVVATGRVGLLLWGLWLPGVMFMMNRVIAGGYGFRTGRFVAVDRLASCSTDGSTLRTGAASAVMG